MKIKLLRFCTIAIIVLLVYFTVFYRLDSCTLFLWDEGRLAVNAVEMYINGFSFIPTYENQPDMWNVKPPLMIWLQTISMHIIGVNELAIRIPSALAAIGTILTILWFFSRIINDVWTGIISVFFLCTSYGYIQQHVVRSGDYDSLLICFLTLYLIMAISFVFTQQYKFYLLFCVFLLCAIFTKGVSGLFFLPGTLFAFVLFGSIKKYLNVKFILPLFFVFLSITLYYIIRDYYNKGYIKTVFFEEVAGRLMGDSFNTGHKWYFHFENMILETFSIGFPFTVLCLLYYKNYNELLRRLILVIVSTLIFFWIPITLSINKNYWYFAPSYVLLSVLSAIFLMFIFRTFFRDIKTYFNKNLAYFSLTIFIFLIPFLLQLNNIHKITSNISLAELAKSKASKNEYSFLVNGYNSVAVFYVNKFKIENRKSSIVNLSQVKKGNTLIVLNKDDLYKLNEIFFLEILEKRHELEVVKILDFKKLGTENYF